MIRVTDVLKMAGISPPEDVGTCTASLTSLKIRAINDSAGPGDCPLCKGRGYIAEEKDGYLVTRECKCEKKRRSLEAIQRSGLADLARDYTLENYQTPEPWQAKIKALAQRYVLDNGGKWFVLCGNPGTGKTHICTAICMALINAGQEVRYMLWRRDAPRLKAEVNDREAYDNDIGRYRKADVLYIDDFFKGGVTEADINLAFELLNDRYNKRAMTIISSERDIEQLMDIDEAIGSRIYERSKGFYAKLPAKNWRLR